MERQDLEGICNLCKELSRLELEDLCSEEKNYPLEIDGEIFCGKNLMEKNDCRFQVEPSSKKYPFRGCVNLIYLEREHLAGEYAN